MPPKERESLAGQVGVETATAMLGVPVRARHRAVKRNEERFPRDFVSRLTDDELRSPRSRTVISESAGRGQHRKYPSYALAEQSVVMLSSVRRSARAVQVNSEIMRTFVRLRRMTGEHADLARKIAAMERKYDAQFEVVFDAIRDSMAAPAKSRARIGSRAKDEG